MDNTRSSTLQIQVGKLDAGVTLLEAENILLMSQLGIASHGNPELSGGSNNAS